MTSREYWHHKDEKWKRFIKGTKGMFKNKSFTIKFIPIPIWDNILDIFLDEINESHKPE
jgi:hypothetical protein